MTLNCTHTLVSVGSSLLQKRINQQHLNHRFFATFRVLSLSEKKLYHHDFFLGKTKFSSSRRLYALVLKEVFKGSLSNCYIHWINLSKRPGNHAQFYVFGNFSGLREWRNSNSGSDKTKIFIDKAPFTLHPLVGLMHNSTTAKEQTNWPCWCLQKKASKLILSLPEWNKWEKR